MASVSRQTQTEAKLQGRDNVHTPHAVGQAIGEVVPLRRGSRSSDENCRGKSKQTVHHQKLRQLNEIQMKNE